MNIQHYGMHRDAETDMYPPSTLVTITLTNETEGHQFSTWTEQHSTEQAPTYKDFQAEYGRCTGKVYVDVDNAPPRAVGWFFISAQKYEDTSERYLRGAWVTIEELPALDFLPATVREVRQARELMAARKLVTA